MKIKSLILAPLVAASLALVGCDSSGGSSSGFNPAATASPISSFKSGDVITLVPTVPPAFFTTLTLNTGSPIDGAVNINLDQDAYVGTYRQTGANSFRFDTLLSSIPQLNFRTSRDDVANLGGIGTALRTALRSGTTPPTFTVANLNIIVAQLAAQSPGNPPVYLYTVTNELVALTDVTINFTITSTNLDLTGGIYAGTYTIDARLTKISYRLYDPVADPYRLAPLDMWVPFFDTTGARPTVINIEDGTFSTVFVP